MIDHGFQLLALVADSQSWVHRRVEAVRLSADTENRVSVSLDMTAPDGVNLLAYPHPVVPVAVMQKNELRKLDVKGDDGRSLSVLTRDENTLLVESMLLALLSEIFPLEVVAHPRGREAIRLAVSSTPAQAHIAVAKFRGWFSAQRTPRQGSEDFEALLWGLLDVFSRCFLLCVQVDDTYIGSRRILKYSHEDLNALEARPNVPMTLTRELGTTSMAGSYHIEIEMPPDVAMRSLAVYERDAVGEWQELAYRENSFAESIMHASFRNELVLQEHYGQTELKALLVPRFAGTCVAAVWASLFTLLLILAGCVLRWKAGDFLQQGQQTDQVAAVLLTVPAVMMTWIGTSREHELVATLKAPFRRMLLISAAVLFAGALLVAIPFTRAIETGIWGTLAAVQAVVATRALRLRSAVVRSV